AMFLWGRWRHDMVAAGSLLACVVAGLVPANEAFAGFGHPAVVTVACVLVLSRGLQTSGAVDALTRVVLPAKAGPTVSIGALVALAAVLSGFMNNVGALALLMPVAIQLAGRLRLPPGKVLMPLAFGSILGGTTTLIGTPPNLIIAGFRDSREGLDGFAMFDFLPVGGPLTLVGVVFIVLVGWRLVPSRKQAGIEGFETGSYLTETRIPADSKVAAMTLREVERALDEIGVQVVSLVRNGTHIVAPRSSRRLHADDILVVEAEADALARLVSDLGLKLEEAVPPKPVDEADGTGEHQETDQPRPALDAPAGDQVSDELTAANRAGEAAQPDTPSRRSDEVALMELAVLPGAMLVGRSARDILLRTRYGLNLLAVSRQGQWSMVRLRSLALRPGDLLLIQGPPETIAEFAADNGCVPLAERELRIPDRRQAILATLIMLASVGVAAAGLLPAAVAFLGGVVASMALRTVSLRSVYEAVDWPVIVLLGALLPVAGAMQHTGAADLIARVLLDSLARGNAVIGLVVILITTMVLTDLMNNAATAAVMAPIGLGAAEQLGVNPDTFLMAVAIGSSCAFLTPIGHQNNTLILGPGGFRFGDYWRLGLPVDLLLISVAVPLLLLAWPL
nr:SLC13 family permease [Desulfobulbus sp.]